MRQAGAGDLFRRDRRRIDPEAWQGRLIGMLIVDSHLDLGWNALQWDRNLELSAHTIRTLEESVPGLGRGQGTVALPELTEGRVCLCFATTLAAAPGGR